MEQLLKARVKNTTVRILKPKRHGDATGDPAEAL